MCSSQVPISANDGKYSDDVTKNHRNGGYSETAIISTSDTKSSINKTTILKYSIATLLLCASSFIAGLYFPYVILTIPTVVFAISIVVALISIVYLIHSLAFALKKKIDLSEKEFDQPAQRPIQLQEPTKEFEYSTGSDKVEHDEVDGRMELKSKSNIPTPTPLLPTTGTASPKVTQNKGASATPPPPPPPPFPNLNQGASAPPPPPPPPPGFFKKPLDLNAQIKATKLKSASAEGDGMKKPEGDRDAMLAQIKQGQKLISKEERDKKLAQKQKEREKTSNGQGDLIAEIAGVLAARRKGVAGNQENKRQQSNSGLEGAFGNISDMIPPPPPPSSSAVSPPPPPPPPGSAQTNGAKQKPPLPPKPVHLQIEPKSTTPITKVSGMSQVNSETNSVKDRAKQWERHG